MSLNAFTGFFCGGPGRTVIGFAVVEVKSFAQIPDGAPDWDKTL